MSRTADTLHRLFPLAAPSAPATPPPTPQAPPDPLALARRVLARWPQAMRDLEDALVAWASGGEAALAAYLATPIEEEETDPLVTLARVQRGLETDLGRLPQEPGAMAARRMLSAILVQVAKGTEAIRQGRPQPPEEDEVRAALERHDAEAHDLIEGTYAEAEALAAQPRAATPEDRGRVLAMVRHIEAGHLPHGVCVTCAAPLIEALGESP